MAAPKGNQFWKLRSKHGRDKLFATPGLLWDAACEYFAWCNKTPWYKNEAVKSGPLAGDFIKVPTQKPYSLSGLCLYLDCSQNYFRKFKSECDNKDFITIITRIEEVIETQQFEGAVVGAFNANIIARKLGLSEKVESQITGKDGKDLRLNIIIKPTSMPCKDTFASSEDEVEI